MASFESSKMGKTRARRSISRVSGSAEFAWIRRRSAPVASILLPVFLIGTLSPTYAAAQTIASSAPISRDGMPARALASSHAATNDVLGAADAATTVGTPLGAGSDRFQGGGSRRAPASGDGLLQAPHPSLGGLTDVGSIAGVADQLTSPEPVDVASLPKGGAETAATAISLPSGAATVGGMGESFTAQLSTGVAAFSIPFGIPRGRGMAQPTLGLVYGSSAGFGVAGVGWALAGPSFIARQTDRGVPKYDDRADWHPEQDRFVFGGHELVPICRVSGTECSGARPGEVMPPWADGWQYFRARVEGSFMRFFWSPDHATWRAQSKDGTSFEFGVPLDGSGDPSGLETHPLSQDVIYRWHVVRQYDAQGEPNAEPPQPVNLIRFGYLKDGGVNYLSDLYITPPAQGAATADVAEYAHHVALRYDLRPDQSSSYRAGWLQQQRLRLVGVDVTSKPFGAGTGAARELVRRYHLQYDPSTHASLLIAVQQEGRCAQPIAEGPDQLLGPTDCPKLPPLRMEYERVLPAPGSEPLLDAQGFEFEGFNEVVHSFADSPPHSLDEELTTLMDINADGLPDVVVTAPASFGGKHGVFFNGLTAGGQRGFGPVTKMGVIGVNGVDANILKLANPNVALLDADADALIDLVHMPVTKRYEVFTPRFAGGAWNWVGRSISTASGQDAKINFTQDAQRTALADVDSDGLVDIIFTSATEVQTFFSLGRYPGGDGQFGHAVWTGPSSASLSNDPVKACVPWSATPVRFGDPGVLLADMNGDGLPDIVRARSGQILYWPGRGNGYWGTGDPRACAAGSFASDQHVTMANPPKFGVSQPGGLRFADVNADGLTDLVEVRFDAVDIYLNDNGSGWSDRHTLSNVPIVPNGTNPVQVTDINGSGSADILWGRGYDYRYVDLTGGVRPYLLRKVHNGLGKTSELEYRSSTELMLDAARAGNPWTSTMPLSMPVVVRSSVLDNLDKIGRAPGRYVTEFSYRDPVFDGRQREFRGFRSADQINVGDENNPTSTTRSTFLLGECEVAQNGHDVCSVGDRWRDNWREPLKGQPAIVEVFDQNGVYATTTNSTYEIRQLYTGRDGRRVSMVAPVQRDVIVYDVAGFVPAATTLTFDAVRVNLDGIVQNETRSVVRRATQGTVQIRSRRTVDDVGNAITETAEGCIAGCPTVDEAITTHATHARPPGDTSGWLWRQTASHVTGSIHTSPRRQMRQEHDAHGNPVRSFATLSGTLPLDRFRAGGGAVAPAPANASGGIDAPVELETGVNVFDVFGNVVSTRRALGKCRSVDFDAEYAELPVTEVLFVGAAGSDGCGQTELVTTAEYDRGLGEALSVVGVGGQPARFDYDGFGRLIARTLADPSSPGNLSQYPTSRYEYLIPDDPSVAPYSIVRTREQDGANPNVDSYRERFAFIDGLGRTLAELAEADPAAGDGGDFVVSGVVERDAKGSPLRQYEPFFWSGPALAYPLDLRPTSGSTGRRHDAFGRPIAAYGLDGQMKARVDYHALSRDVWDAADLAPGPHRGSYLTSRRDGHDRTVQNTERVRVGATLQQRHSLIEYLPTGEIERLIERVQGFPDVVRWLRYDSLGRMVMNVEPNTSVGFNPSPTTDPATIRAYRYAYDAAGKLVGTSDARGCGVNYFYDAAGRITAEDYSPCEPEHAPYTPFDPETGAGAEVQYRYDTPDPETASVVDDAGTVFAPVTVNYLGRLASVADRGSKVIVRYDARGRTTGSAIRVARPRGTSGSSPYAPRWYIQEIDLDAASRAVSASTGATTAELLGPDGTSRLTQTFSARGLLISSGSSYGNLVNGLRYAADGALTELTLGDAAGTRRSYDYDEFRRLRTVQTYRAAPELWSTPDYAPPGPELTQQLLLEDYQFEYDAANNVTKVTDWRIPQDWPASAKPVTRRFEYDDRYRLIRAVYEYAGGTDFWSSPSAGGNAVPAVTFDNRITEQRFAYDHLGNTTRTSDDASGFYDRSLGQITNGTGGSGPHQMVASSNRSGGGARQGDLSAGYDAAGNVTGLIVRRDGPCQSGASCWQRFAYSWDEVGNLSRARRWDLRSNPDERGQNGSLSSPLPARSPDVDLQYTYDMSGDRVLKTAVDANGDTRHTVYVFPTLELRSAAWLEAGGSADYELDTDTVNVVLSAAGVRARVIHRDLDLPNGSLGGQSVLLELSDHLGSSTFVIDRATGELVEFSTYQAYGAAESDYRPERWGSFRDPQRFGGKEEDVEVGLHYFGGRYYSTGLARWMSPDPATIHFLRSDPNPYAYVHGRPLVVVDPNGTLPVVAAILVGALIGMAIAGGANVAAQVSNNRGFDWGSFGIALGVGALAGALAGATIGMNGIAAAKFVFAYSNVGHAALGWVAVAGLTVPAGAIIGTTVAGASGADWKDTLKYAGYGTEAGLLVAAGGALGHATGAALGALGIGGAMLPVYTAAAGALNGAITGWRGIYDWGGGTGFLAFASDSTWGLVGTTLGSIMSIGNTLAGAGYRDDLSRRQNRQVFLEGFYLKPGAAFTQGNTISNLNTDQGSFSPGLLDHETLHITQNRIFGPAFQTTYVAWAVGGGIVATVYVGVQFLRGRKINLWDALYTVSYQDNPWEYWAYQEHNPSGRNPKVPELGF